MRSKKYIPDHSNNTKIHVAIYDRNNGNNCDDITYIPRMKAQYSRLLKSHPDWELVDIYRDINVSGSSNPLKRPGYSRLFTDCKKGKIDLVVAKSISVISRNIAELTYQIGSLGLLPRQVNVFFINENIDTRENNEDVLSSFIKTFFSETEINEKHAIAKDLLYTRYANGIFKESQDNRTDYHIDDIDDFVIVPREIFRPKGRK